MPVHVFYSFRSARNVFILAISLVTIAFFTHTAYADPHAVFYTDRAQEQLFYNTLAALNQADFVEPGLDNQTQYTRDFLVARRSAAVARANPQPNDKTFSAEQNPIINSTHTDLPGVVTRNITLEGNDLWTAYLINQFALETVTRRSESQLARILCERGLGRTGCSSAPGKSQLETKAFVNTPLTQDNVVNGSVKASLASGTDDALRQELRSSNGNEPVNSIVRPYSPSLAALNKNITNNSGAKELLKTLTNNLTSEGSVDPETFSDVTFDSNGIPKLANNIQSAEAYSQKLSQLHNLSDQLASISANSKNQALAVQEYIQKPTTKADYILKSQNPDGTGALYPEIIVPASAKIAQVNAGAQLLANTATSQKFTNPRSIVQAGDQSLVDPTLDSSLVAPPGDYDNFDAFSGFALNTNNSNGQVAGISTLDPAVTKLYKENYFDPQTKTLSPSVYDQSAISEPGLLELREAYGDVSQKLDPKSSSNVSAFSIDLKNLLQGSQATMDNILCSWFPSIERCVGKESNTL